LSLPQLSDSELIEALRKGEQAAFDELYRRHWRKVYALAYQKLRKRELAEELVQDLFVSLWMRRESLQINGALDAYLGMATRYLVIKFFQKERSRQEYAQQAALQPLSANPTEDSIFFDDLQQIIEQEINKLPEKCRHVFQLSRQSNLSQKEISLRLDISEKTVENHMTRALRLLRFGLKDFISSVLILLFL
jgi:RNA polymerase sigma-70 factor (ECF subfamily)